MSLVTCPKIAASHAAELASSLVIPAQCVQAELDGIPVSRLESAALLGIAAAELGNSHGSPLPSCAMS